MIGKFQTTMESRKNITVATIYVAEADGGCLLKAITAEELGLITQHLNQITTTQPTHKGTQTAAIDDKGVQRIVEKYLSVFQGPGKLIELIIDNTVKAVAQNNEEYRSICGQRYVECELKKLQEDDIIEPAPDTEQTDWISPLVIVPKKDDQIRLCVDMRAANTAIKRFVS